MLSTLHTLSTGEGRGSRYRGMFIILFYFDFIKAYLKITHRCTTARTTKRNGIHGPKGPSWSVGHITTHTHTHSTGRDDNYEEPPDERKNFPASSASSSVSNSISKEKLRIKTRKRRSKSLMWIREIKMHPLSKIKLKILRKKRSRESRAVCAVALVRCMSYHQFVG